MYLPHNHINFKKFLSYSLFILLFGQTVNASTLYTNIKGYTSTEQGLLQFDALLFDDDGKILATLSKDAIKDRIKSEQDVKIVDGHGKFMLPGLIDAHGHLLSYATTFATVDLVGTQSVEEATNRIKQFSIENPSLNWIIGRGWNQVFWAGKKFPKAESLDAIAVNKPMAFNRIDGHAMWVNSKAMELAGINKNTLDPAGGEIIRDQSGNPTGVLVDNAMDMVFRKMTKKSVPQRVALLKTALPILSSEGITSVHDAGVSDLTIDAFKNMAQHHQLPIRIYAMLSVTDDDYHKALARGPEPSLFDDFLSIRSIKIQMDGALGSRGAAFDEPYSDRPETSGLLLHTPEETKALTLEAMKAGFQVNSHAIGDKGNRILLDIFSQFPQYRDLRHRIEHAQIVHVEDIPRFKELNVIPSMQPTHATSDKNMAKDRIGEKRLEGAYAWRKFLKQGSRIASGSDFPVEPSNPFFGLHAAVTRQDRDNQPVGGWRPQDKMTREEALRSFTLDAAYAAHQENVIGSLEKGKWADFILVDQDFFKMDQKDIWKMKVLETWVAGKKVYSKTKD